MKYLTAQEILFIHAKIIDASGGIHGVRDVERVASMVERPKQKIGGKELYPTVFKKAAVYFEVSAYHHCFSDGNKRTAFACTARFLYVNGYQLQVTTKEIVNFVVDAVVKKYNNDEIAGWLQKYSKRVK